MLTFRYSLMYRMGDLDEEPIGPTEEPLNLIAVASSTGPTMAVIWGYTTKIWEFRPEVAAAVLYADSGRHRTRLVDRGTAEREALRFTETQLPTEKELTEICRAGRPG